MVTMIDGKVPRSEFPIDAATESAAVGSGPLVLTAHELIYIIGLDQTEMSGRNTELLALPSDDAECALAAMGASTLFARGLAVVENGEIVLGSAAGLAGYILTQSTRWIEIGIVAKDVLDAMIGFEHGRAKFILKPSVLGTFEVFFVGLDDSLEQIFEKTAREFMGVHEPSMCAVYSGNVHGAQSMAAIRDATKVWSVATEIDRPFDESLARNRELLRVSSQEGVFTLLSATLASR